jgi:hypothetical protein
MYIPVQVQCQRIWHGFFKMIEGECVMENCEFGALFQATYEVRVSLRIQNHPGTGFYARYLMIRFFTEVSHFRILTSQGRRFFT